MALPARASRNIRLGLAILAVVMLATIYQKVEDRRAAAPTLPPVTVAKAPSSGGGELLNNASSEVPQVLASIKRPPSTSFERLIGGTEVLAGDVLQFDITPARYTWAALYEVPTYGEPKLLETMAPAHNGVVPHTLAIDDSTVDERVAFIFADHAMDEVEAGKLLRITKPADGIAAANASAGSSTVKWLRFAKDKSPLLPSPVGP